MALLELGGKKFTIPVGEVTLGSDAACAISLAGAAVLPQHALLQGQADGQVIIRKASPAAEVLINGVRLGAEPTPLLHGDKVEVGGHELTFVDERRTGSTQFVKAFTPATAGGPAKPSLKAPAIGVTGGRVVSLTDGREYVITGASLVFGREAGCDVVVAGKDVSRRHAEILLTPKGYVVVDSSTNGTFVNEERVEGQRILARADVLRLGDEQFRFYADAAPATAAAPPPPGPAASPPLAAPPAPAATSQVGAPGQAVPPPGATERLRHTVHGLEAFVPAGGSLASFLVRSGGLIGQRLAVKTPIVNIGRADYNDLVVPDPSISTSHAKLQRREGVWVLVDLDSTNGTFVDGERVKGEAPLAPGATVRLGDVQLVFEPTDDALRIAKGGGTQVLKTPHSIAPNVPPKPASSPPASAPPPTAPRGSPAPGPKAPPPLMPQAPSPSRPSPRPAPKRPVAQQPPPKKSKGCGGSAAALLVAGVALVALLHRLLA
jgi:pSer/pThr/pTyr-binding forkhead associated (FHA) protein